MEVVLCDSLIRSGLNSARQRLRVIRPDGEGASCLCLGRLSDSRSLDQLPTFYLFYFQCHRPPPRVPLMLVSLPLGHLHLCHHFLHLLIYVLSSPSPSSSCCNSGNSGHNPPVGYSVTPSIVSSNFTCNIIAFLFLCLVFIFIDHL